MNKSTVSVAKPLRSSHGAFLPLCCVLKFIYFAYVLYGVEEASLVHRLTTVQHEKSQALKHALQSEFYDQFTFRPSLNKISRVLGRPSSVDELVEDPRGRKVPALLCVPSRC
jgi:hypothetical protein